MANRFRDPVMRKQYDVLVKCYHEKHHDLFHKDGSRKRMCSIATYFWWGFDNIKPGAGDWTQLEKSWVAYACWRAGQDMGIESRNEITEERS